MAEEEKLEKLLDELVRLKDEILRVGKKHIEVYDGFYAFDIYCTAILNKSINILAGYILLIKNNNFISAAPLVRIHLDSLLRIYAPQISGKDVDDFALNVLDGKPINKIKDKSANLLTDGFLARQLSKKDKFDWVHQVYKVGSSFVHFSDSHIFASAKANSNETRTMDFVVGEHDNFVSLEEKVASAIYMKKITEGIILIVNSWAEQKKTYNRK